MKQKFFLLTVLPVLLFPSLVLAATNTELGQVEDFGDLISKIWSWGFVVILSLSVAMIVVGGFLYMASGGSDERVDQAKQIINGSLISSAIVLFSGVIQRLLARPTENLQTQGGSLTLGQLPEAAKNATNIMLAMIGGFAVVMIIISAYQYITSRGDVGKLDRAKRGFIYSLIGLGVSITAFVTMNTFIGVFKG